MPFSPGKIMRKILLLALLPLLAVDANAQSMDNQTSAAIEPAAGLTVLNGDGSEYLNPGFSLGVTAWSSPTKQVQFGVGLVFSRCSVDEEALLEDAGIPTNAGVEVEGGQTIIDVGPRIRLNLVPADQKIIPFLQGGLSMYFGSADLTMTYRGEEILSMDDSGNDPGASLGGGLQIQLSPTARLVVAPAYHIIFSDDESRYFSLLGALNFGF